MSIQKVLALVPGKLSSDPQLVYIGTNDTVATVTTAGYLNDAQVANGNIFTNAERVLVGTQASVNAAEDLQWMSIAIASPNVSLTASASGSSAGSIAGFPAIVSSSPKNSFVSGISADMGGNGATFDVSLSGLTATGQVLLEIQSSSAPVSINSLVVNAGSYHVVLSADPGASCIFDYMAVLS